MDDSETDGLKAYEAALLEVEPRSWIKRLYAAETAIFFRLEGLDSSGRHTERCAIAEALDDA
jgi:hypothetical protein